MADQEALVVTDDFEETNDSVSDAESWGITPDQLADDEMTTVANLEASFGDILSAVDATTDPQVDDQEMSDTYSHTEIQLNQIDDANTTVSDTPEPSDGQFDAEGDIDGVERDGDRHLDDMNGSDEHVDELEVAGEVHENDEQDVDIETTQIDDASVVSVEQHVVYAGAVVANEDNGQITGSNQITDDGANARHEEEYPQPNSDADALPMSSHRMKGGSIRHTSVSVTYEMTEEDQRKRDKSLRICFILFGFVVILMAVGFVIYAVSSSMASYKPSTPAPDDTESP